MMDQREWKRYTWQFKRTALDNDLSPDDIEHCLVYAKKLNETDLPIIYDEVHFSTLVGYSIDYLFGASNSPHKYYRSFRVKKHRGGHREISEPLPSLKEIQRWVLDNLLSKIALSEYAKGFIPNRSIRDNARFHRRQSILVKLDIKDFFGSIRISKVFNVFRSMGYSNRVSGLLSHLCTLDGRLPQGAPTSPYLSNIVAKPIDYELSRFVIGELKCRYTRYADDITVSGHSLPVGALIRRVEKVLSTHGFSLNIKKTQVLKQHQRQMVTGIVVNQHLRAPREMRRQLRQSIYYMKKFGVDSHMRFIGEQRANYIRHLLGIAGFILFINPQDQDAKQAKIYLEGVLKQSKVSERDGLVIPGQQPEIAPSGPERA